MENLLPHRAVLQPHAFFDWLLAADTRAVGGKATAVKGKKKRLRFTT